MIQTMEQLFRLPRRQKRVIQVLVDVVLLAGSFLGAMMLRLDNWSPIFEWETWLSLLVTIPFSVMVFKWLGFYRAVIRYINLKALQAIVAGILVSAVALGVTSHLVDLGLPLTVPFIYAMLGLLTVGGVRFFLRGLYLRSLMRHKMRVVIYGAGSAGSQLVTSLSHGNEYAPIGFIDDWRGMYGTLVEGLKVYSPSELPQLIENYGVERILLAIPSATRSRRREILKSLENLPIPVQTVPAMDDVVAGRARINEIRDVAIEDLLGRDPVPSLPNLLDANIRNKVVMVTGAGGSIGSELCRQIVMQQPRQLLLLEICEYALYRIESELQQLVASQDLQISIKALLGSVQQRTQMDALMRIFQVQTIYHAAAYKHVPMVEHNVVEGIRNNVYGTLETARAAIDCGVETFVLVSTDKAVRPTNVMGTTKRLAELICQALAHHQQTTRFCMVRFGNVLGSSGSVVPLFHQQIKAGGPITVTHPEITRYFMTIPEAAQLVIQAGAMGRGGDVFVLDMGEPVKIAELARQMIRLSGLEMITEDNPGGDIAITYSGLRPGEKLYEELLIGENVTQTAHPRIMTANETFWQWPQLNAYLQQLYMAVSNAQHEWIRQLLQQAPTAYRPEGPIADLVWKECDVPAVRVVKPLRHSPTEQAANHADLLKVSTVSLAKGGTHS
ncbi:polysaccharide biosynthesis protein [Litchfieldella rifensis]|uniref:Polysaccharide biosynthesis protein n=1 Tax=Litchfieldella rifensis TaxID=762643 RepID=A0ABV7LSI6_9GAMM